MDCRLLVSPNYSLNVAFANSEALSDFFYRLTLLDEGNDFIVAVLEPAFCAYRLAVHVMHSLNGLVNGGAASATSR